MIKSRLVSALALAALGCVTVTAQAAGPQPYFGVSFAGTTFELDGYEDDAAPNVLLLKLGVYLNEFVSFEGRIGGGVSSDTIDIGGVPVDVDIDYITGYYARFHLPLGDRLKPYAMAGFSNVGITATGNSVATGEDTDVSYGFGADMGLSDTVLFNVEWVNYIDKGGAEISAASAGVHIGF